MYSTMWNGTYNTRDLYNSRNINANYYIFFGQRIKGLKQLK